MKQENRSIRLDEVLGVEACRLSGIVQRFPNHFHEYYMIGLIEAGARRLSCRNEDYVLRPGDMVALNPLDNHACEAVDESPLDYRALHIPIGVMETLGFGRPHFASPVLTDGTLSADFRKLHRMITEEEPPLDREEAFYFFMERLLSRLAATPSDTEPDARVETVCRYLEERFASAVSLEELAGLACLNKYSLLRAFVRKKGITPYRYLEAVRINRAKALLEEGIRPADAALQTGFVDQSHFSRCFLSLTGLTPGQYWSLFHEKGGNRL